jgi:ParB/RepB/Spo0J family partition protein
MKEKIEMIDVALIVEHPRERELYGEPIADDELVDSIRHRGIVVPLIVTKNNFYDIDLLGGVLAVAGHRRRIGAIKAGLEKIPCIIRKYNTVEELEADMIISNRQRKKEPRILKAEMDRLLALYETESLAKSKLLVEKEIQASRLTLNKLNKQPNSPMGENTPSDDDYADEVAGIAVDADADAKQVHKAVAKALGISNKSAERLLAVCNAGYFNAWKSRIEYKHLKTKGKEIPGERLDAITNAWAENNDSYLDEQRSLREAYDNWQKIRKEFETKALGGGKKPAAKQTKGKPKKKMPPLFIDISPIPTTWSQMPNAFIGEEVADIVIKTAAGNDFGIIKSHSAITGFCLHAGKKLLKIDLDALAMLCEKE